MSYVEFKFGAATTVRVDYQPDGTTTLLELARIEDLPLHWRCGLGTCGTCAIRLTLLAGQAQPMGNKERNVLAHHGKNEQQNASDWHWRLGCSYILNGADLRAEWD
ncbi:MAG: 2Fe-2S iron-sulfur cluster-binding protein [Burkholderiales bacterium]|jgi:ferredoxin